MLEMRISWGREGGGGKGEGIVYPLPLSNHRARGKFLSDFRFFFSGRSGSSYVCVQKKRRETTCMGGLFDWITWILHIRKAAKRRSGH